MLGQNQETQYWQLALSLPHEKGQQNQGFSLGREATCLLPTRTVGLLTV